MKKTTSPAQTFYLTGSAGWLGKRVLLALTKGMDFPQKAVGQGGHRVVALARNEDEAATLRALGAEPRLGSLEDAASLAAFLKGAEGAKLLHMAGLIHPRLFTRDFARTNTQGTHNLLLAAATSGVGRMVVMSSNSPIGCNPTPSHVFTEESPYHPYMGYGRSKMRMEQDLRSTMGLPGYPAITIVRAPWFYGPGQPPRQTQFFRMVQSGKFPIMGAGLNRRSMGYVDSLAYGMLLAAATPKAAGQIYWLADAEPYTMVEIINTVKAVLHEDFGLPVAEKNLHVPSQIADVAWLADTTLQSVGLYQQKIHVLSEMNKTIACTITKAQAELGYQPLCNLREGMRRSVEWCLANGQTI